MSHLTDVTRKPASDAACAGVDRRAAGRPRRMVRVAVTLVRWACRLVGHDGHVLPGRVAVRMQPSCLTRLSAGRTVVLVSGTNGKTTTTAMLSAAMRRAGPVASNASGANMPGGLATALLDGNEPTAVLEVDEQYLATAIHDTRPAAVLMLNLSRDQLDRVGEMRTTAARWRVAIADTDAAVIANADDPLVCWAVGTHHDAVWVAAGRADGLDGRRCPWCAGPIDAAPNGGWACAGCGAARPDPRWRVLPGFTPGSARLRGPDGVERPLRAVLPGAANLGNAAMAIVAAEHLGVPATEALSAVCAVDQVSGRYATLRRGAQTIWLLLAKNPAGWAATLEIIAEGDGPVVISVNAAQADGRDTSWLYDVPFEGLAGRDVVATGVRADDVGVRLAYAGVSRRIADGGLTQALRLLPAGPVTFVGDYTSFRDGYRLVRPESTVGSIADRQPPAYGPAGHAA